MSPKETLTLIGFSLGVLSIFGMAIFLWRCRAG